MSIDPRLSAKLDQALGLIKPHRRPNGECAKAFVADVRARCTGREPFTIAVDGVGHTVRPSEVRVSRTCIEMGPVRIPLASVARAWREEPTDPEIYEFAASDASDDAPARRVAFAS